MAVYDDLLNDVMPEIPGSPPLALVQDSIKAAVLDFIESGLAVYRETEPLDWPAGTGHRNLTHAVFGNELISSAERVVRLIGAQWNGRELTKASSMQLTSVYGPEWRSMTGEPKHYLHYDKKIQLFPEPGAVVNALRLNVFIVPTEAAADFPDDVLNNHREYLANGAKAKLFYMSNVPWSNPGLGDVNYRLFRQRIEAEKVKAVLVFSGAARQTKPFWF